MPRLRRSHTPNGTYFVTCVTHNRQPWFRRNAFAQIVIDQWNHYENEYRFQLHTYCVMSDHYHVVLTEGESKNLSQILHSVNSYIVTSINLNLGREKKIKIFEGNPWVEEMMSEEMFWQKIAYTLFNPWREGTATSPLNYYEYSDIGVWIEEEGEEFLLDLFSKYKRWYE